MDVNLQRVKVKLARAAEKEEDKGVANQGDGTISTEIPHPRSGTPSSNASLPEEKEEGQKMERDREETAATFISLV